MKALKFDTKGNKEVNEAIQRLLFALGYKWPLSEAEPQHLGARYLYANTDSLLQYGTQPGTFNNEPHIRVDWVEQAFCSIKLNDKYTAEVRDGKVKVGCQSFDFDAVERLYEAVKRERDNG